MRSASLIGDELCQNSAGRLRVDERHLESEEAVTRLLVDQPGAVGAQPGELGSHVVDLECDVVHARAAAFEEAADGRVGPERGEQLDAIGAHAQRGGLDTLVGNGLAMLERRAEERRPVLDGGIEVVDGHAEVMDAAHHSASTSAVVATLTPSSRQWSTQAAERAASSPREASSTKVTVRPRATSPRTAASSQTSVATPKSTISSGSSRSRSMSACGFVNTSKCFFRSRNSRPSIQRGSTGVSASGTGSRCIVAGTFSAPGVPRRQCGGYVRVKSGAAEISSSDSSWSSADATCVSPAARAISTSCAIAGTTASAPGTASFPSAWTKSTCVSTSQRTRVTRRG